MTNHRKWINQLILFYDFKIGLGNSVFFKLVVVKVKSILIVYDINLKRILVIL